MPSALPEGEPAPRDGGLPDAALEGRGTRPFGVYVHVPFCTTRCGYCDFNTYTDLGGMQASYAEAVVTELRLARRVLGDGPPVSTEKKRMCGPMCGSHASKLVASVAPLPRITR